MAGLEIMYLSDVVWLQLLSGSSELSRNSFRLRTSTKQAPTFVQHARWRAQNTQEGQIVFSEISHVWMSHVTRMNKSFHTYE